MYKLLQALLLKGAMHFSHITSKSQCAAKTLNQTLQRIKLQL